MEHEITMYSTGCPMCRVLRSKLDAKQIEYKVNTSIEDMEALGLTRVPALMIDGKLFVQADAIRWVNQQQSGGYYGNPIETFQRF